MKAAGEARNDWARRRPGRSSRPMPGGTARIGTVLSFVLAFFVLACAAAGLFETQRNDSRSWAEQHAALDAALGELRGVLGDTIGTADHFDAGQLALIERRAGLRDLRFDGALADERGRDVQSVHDPQGRILGWFSWTPDREFVVAMDWLWGLLAATALVLAVGGYLAMRATRRLVVAFARSRDTVRRLDHAGRIDRVAEPAGRAATARRHDRLARIARSWFSR